MGPISVYVFIYRIQVYFVTYIDVNEHQPISGANTNTSRPTNKAPKIKPHHSSEPRLPPK